MSDTRAEIINAIRQIGATDEECARKVGFTPRTLDNWEAGVGLETTIKLVDAGVLQVAHPLKEIITLFETIGKRRKLIGFKAKYDGATIGTFDTHDEAQAELDRIAYELTKVGAW